jgi:hypothetical protein
VQALHDLPQAFDLRRQRGDIALELVVSLPEIGVLPHQAVRRSESHRFGLQLNNETALGISIALTTRSAEATKSGDIAISDTCAASGTIDRFGRGTRPMAPISYGDAHPKS